MSEIPLLHFIFSNKTKFLPKFSIFAWKVVKKLTSKENMRFYRAFIVRHEHMHRNGQISVIIFELKSRVDFWKKENLQTYLDFGRTLTRLVFHSATGTFRLVPRSMVVIWLLRGIFRLHSFRTKTRKSLRWLSFNSWWPAQRPFLAPLLASITFRWVRLCNFYRDIMKFWFSLLL